MQRPRYCLSAVLPHRSWLLSRGSSQTRSQPSCALLGGVDADRYGEEEEGDGGDRGDPGGCLRGSASSPVQSAGLACGGCGGLSDCGWL
jgi:hypothetical protein